MYPIVQAPSEILRSKAVPANLTPKKLNEIISGMTNVLLSQKDPEGVGLAANQVGLPYQIFLARFTTKKTEPVRIFINPKIVDHSEEIQNETKDSPLEGCLSIPKYYGVVQRWKWVKLEYQTPLSSWSDPATAGEAIGSSKIDSISRYAPSRMTKDSLQHDDEILETRIDTFEGFPAVVIQHEMDHLNGTVFVERILEQNGRLYKQSLRPSAIKVPGKKQKLEETWEEVKL